MSGQNAFEKYLANPELMPTDEASLAQMMLEEAGGDVPLPYGHVEGAEAPVVERSENVPEGGESKASGTQDADQGTDEGPQTEDRGEAPAPVATRDGKHTIPYDVLANEREARRAAQQLAAERERELEELRRQLAERHAESQAAAEQGDAQAAAEADQQADELETLVSQLEEAASEEFSAPVKALFSEIQRLKGMLAERAPQEPARQQGADDGAPADDLPAFPAEMKASRPEFGAFEQAMHGNAELMGWFQANPQAWDLACKLEMEARSLPWFEGSFSNDPTDHANRLKYVVTQVKSQIEQGKTTPTPVERRPYVPTSHTGIPGGAPPTSGDTLDHKLIHGEVDEIARLFDGKSVEDIIAMSTSAVALE